ncbi:DUF6631 family protein [Azomonas macrocytogenes]|uniref:Uncharacterized protein n=1 Tax=Azomonas macrocytogenes TaxID=69962 RepID=A0A839T4W2_AZOMA|nr:DUF6631 family protein [Azomonas macrocytogenes]MBB3103800.1 hypothetical protein [Azomonas macrocytogenes]
MEKTAKQPDVESDLDILNPDKHLTIAGEKIVMRELRFGQLMEFGVELKAVSDDFSALADQELEGDAGIDRLLDILFENKWAVMPLVSACCDKPVEWIDGLTQQEGQDLLIIWWLANNSFFVNRRVRKQLAQRRQGGESSLPPSSPEVIDSATSSATPSAS